MPRRRRNRQWQVRQESDGVAVSMLVIGRALFLAQQKDSTDYHSHDEDHTAGGD
jgi:hypothetical protein